MKHIVYEDGSFDLLGAHISLRGCYPAVNGCAVRPIRVEASKTSIIYHLPRGSVKLRFQADAEDRLLLCCSAEGLAGCHDLAPLGDAVIEGAERIYAQGFGMEGPSGHFALTDNAPTSHGLAALYRGEHVLLAYAEDHRRYSLALQARNRTALFGEDVRFTATFNLEGTAGDEIILPALCVEESAGLADSLHRCAERIAAAMGARHDKPPAFFWSSWYHAYETMDQTTLEETLAGIRAEGTPFQYIELDAGYTPHLGDWPTPNHRWPGGLRRAAKTILDAGFQPGVCLRKFGQ